jgi:uncharacterized membrane protein YoaK (UPF0700 family)
VLSEEVLVMKEPAMSTVVATATRAEGRKSHTTPTPSRAEQWLPTLLSVIAGMVDLTGFLTLGIFTAHVTGNIVLVGALIVRHGRVNPAQILAIPVFVIAVAVTWLIAKASARRGLGLMRLLLLIQFLLIATLLIFSATTKPSVDPRGVMATFAAMIAVTTMGCQYALLRLTLPVAPSTAVMTGNLTNAVLGLLDLISGTQPLIENDRKRLTRALRLLVGFFVGCVLATAAVIYLRDWAWSLPTALAAVAVALCSGDNIKSLPAKGPLAGKVGLPTETADA